MVILNIVHWSFTGVLFPLLFDAVNCDGFLQDCISAISLVGEHKLLASVIPAVEREYFEELIEDNKIHLSSMMSVLNRFINNPESESRMRELKKDKHAQQFMFVDEFQDTDDSQIESLLRISQVLDYKLFLVGDIKQCIYRFRGAKEKAFDQLGIAENPDKCVARHDF